MNELVERIDDLMATNVNGKVAPGTARHVRPSLFSTTIGKDKVNEDGSGGYVTTTSRLGWPHGCHGNTLVVRGGGRFAYVCTVYGEDGEPTHHEYEAYNRRAVVVVD